MIEKFLVFSECNLFHFFSQDRLNDVLKRWQEYRGNLETTDRFLKQEFPHWLKETDSDTPDSKNDAQRKMEGVKVWFFTHF